mmetsp:Transcript_22132/g.35599  ORF Transcript_22132/g.35599 Transcript_22132/m.35599 type:complete len:305 (+) Transcript_22132:280-1194(+)
MLDVVVESSMVPDLSGLFDIVAQHRAMIQIVIFTAHRSPTQVHREMLAWNERLSSSDGRTAASSPQPFSSSATTSSSTTSSSNNNDCLEFTESQAPEPILDAIHRATGGSISSTDFMPLGAVFSILQPFLSKYKHFMADFNISPFLTWAIGTCLVPAASASSPAAASSNAFPNKKKEVIPISQIFNLNKTAKDLAELAQKVKSNDFDEIKTAKQIYSVLKSNVLPRAERSAKKVLNLFDTSIMKILANKGSRAGTDEFVQNMQYIIVHNCMDFASIDAVKRCNCPVLTPKSTGRGYAAASTRCF